MCVCFPLIFCSFIFHSIFLLILYSCLIIDSVISLTQDKQSKLENLQSKAEHNNVDSSGDHSEEKEKLVGECKELREKLIDTEQLLKERSNQLNAINEQNHKDDTSYQELLVKLEQLQTQLSSSGKEVDKLLEGRKNDQDEKSKAVCEMKEQLDAERDRCVEQKGKVKELSAMLQKLDADVEKKIVQLQEEGNGQRCLLEEKIQEIERLKKERDEEQEQMNNQVAQLVKDLSEKNEDLKRLTAEVENNHKRALNTGAGMQVIKNEMNTLKEQLVQKDQCIQQLTQRKVHSQHYSH